MTNIIASLSLSTEYRSIPKCPAYFISPTGHIRNSYKKTVKTYNSSGYEGVKLLNDNGERKSFLVHRLVVETYIGPIPDKMWVNHKDGNKLNNCVENLEIITPSMNHLHARDVLKRHYARGLDTAHGVLSPRGVEAIKFLLANGWSQNSVAEAFRVSNSAIHRIAHLPSSEVELPHE
jgi:hypothetical protein